MPHNVEIKVLNKGIVKLVDAMGNDKSIVDAARVSYGANEIDKTPDDDRNLIRYLMRNRHTTPFEMVEFKFYIKLPIFVERQMIRHRTASVNEYSGRYSKMEDDMFIPDIDTMMSNNKINKQSRDGKIEMSTKNLILIDMETEQKSSYKNYELYLNLGLAKELSRINLPLSTYTKKYWKMDLHNLFHFLKLRLDSHAQYEIRQYANAIYQLIKPIVPIACEAFEDYMLNSITFSKNELQILYKNVSDINYIINNIDTFDFFSKTEKIEFKNKLEKMIIK